MSLDTKITIPRLGADPSIYRVGITNGTKGVSFLVQREDYPGGVSLTLTPEDSYRIAEALIKCAANAVLGVHGAPLDNWY